MYMNMDEDNKLNSKETEGTEPPIPNTNCDCLRPYGCPACGGDVRRNEGFILSNPDTKLPTYCNHLFAIDPKKSICQRCHTYVVVPKPETLSELVTRVIGGSK